MTQLFVDTLANEAGTGPTELTGQSAATLTFMLQDAAGTPTTNNNTLNVSSITDDGTGRYTANITNSFAASSETYPAGTMCQSDDANSVFDVANCSSSALAVSVVDQSSTSTDEEFGVVSHGTLA